MDSGNITSIGNNLTSDTLSGTATTAVTTNTTGYYLNGLWYPYNYNYPYYTTSYGPVSDIQIRKAANGFIVISKGLEYVFDSAKKMNVFLNKELGKK